MKYLLMIALTGGMIYCMGLHRRKQTLFNMPAHFGVYICGAICALLAIMQVISAFAKVPPSEKGKSILGAEECATHFLGKIVANNHEGQKVLVILSPGTMKTLAKRDEARLKGFKDAIGDQCNLVIEKMPVVENKRWHDAYSFDDIVAKHPDCKVVVSLVGAPKNLFYDVRKQEDVWPKLKISKSKPDIYMFRGYTLNVDRALEYKLLKGVVLVKNSMTLNNKKLKPEKTDEFFHKHYIWVSPTNVGIVRNGHPKLFPKF